MAGDEGVAVALDGVRWRVRHAGNYEFEARRPGGEGATRFHVADAVRVGGVLSAAGGAAGAVAGALGGVPRAVAGAAGGAAGKAAGALWRHLSGADPCERILNTALVAITALKTVNYNVAALRVAAKLGPLKDTIMRGLDALAALTDTRPGDALEELAGSPVCHLAAGAAGAVRASSSPSVAVSQIVLEPAAQFLAAHADEVDFFLELAAENKAHLIRRICPAVNILTTGDAKPK